MSQVLRRPLLRTLGFSFETRTVNCVLLIAQTPSPIRTSPIGIELLILIPSNRIAGMPSLAATSISGTNPPSNTTAPNTTIPTPAQYPLTEFAPSWRTTSLYTSPLALGGSSAEHPEMTKETKTSPKWTRTVRTESLTGIFSAPISFGDRSAFTMMDTSPFEQARRRLQSLTGSIAIDLPVLPGAISAPIDVGDEGAQGTLGNRPHS